jgi:hypothetical protein
LTRSGVPAALLGNGEYYSDDSQTANGAVERSVR